MTAGPDNGAAVDARRFGDAARQVIDRVAAGGGEQVTRAVDLIAGALRAGGVLQAFGTGHSEALAMELVGRVPINKISLRDVAVVDWSGSGRGARRAEPDGSEGDAPREVLHGEKLERDPEIAHQLHGLAAPRPQDVSVVASSSGINGRTVEFALLVEQHAHSLIAITSAEHTARVAPRHPSGRRLAEIADVLLGNGAPYGDALLPPPGGGTVGAISSITSALLGQLVAVEVARQLKEAGQVPPIYLSAHVPGGDEHNTTLESRYAGRIRRTA